MIGGREPVKTGEPKHSRHSSGPGNAQMKARDVLPYLGEGDRLGGGVKGSEGRS